MYTQDDGSCLRQTLTHVPSPKLGEGVTRRVGVWVEDSQLKDSMHRLFKLILLTTTLFSSLHSQDHRWPDSTLSFLTLEEKIGQLFVVELVASYSHHDSPSYQYALEMVRKFHVGGFLLAGGNTLDIPMVTNMLQKESKLPLLINGDLEAGFNTAHPWRWNRGWSERLPLYVSGGGTAFPSQMAIGATGNTKYAFEFGRITALEARAVGIQWTNSPVADVNNNPNNPIVNTRSYGEDPVRVARMVEAYVHGLQQEHMIATLKHFPGHGDTEQDTHMGLAVLPFTQQRLDSVEIVPFKAGINAGAKAIMTAHLALPLIDPTKRPATLSKPILTGILRERLGFQGIIMTDAMRMQGVTDQFSTEEATVLTIEAGADVVLVPPDIEKAQTGVLAAVKSGRISMQRIDESVRRILSVKSWLGLEKNRTVNLDSIFYVVGAPAHEAMAQEISDASVTLLRNQGSLLPLKAGQRIHAITITEAPTLDRGIDLCNTLNPHTASMTLSHISNETGSERIRLISAELKQADVVIAAVYISVGAWKGNQQFSKPLAQFLGALGKLRTPVILVAFGDPYILAKLPATDVVMTPYNGTVLAERSIGKAIMGSINIGGKLPVTLPGRYKLDDGIQLKTRK